MFKIFIKPINFYRQVIVKNKLQIIALAIVLVPVLAVCLLLSLRSVMRFLQVTHSVGSWRDNPYYYRAATEKPKRDKLVGKYILTKQELTFEGLDFLQGKQATIEIFRNGSFTITNHPMWKRDETNKYNFKCGRLVSTTGQWRIIDLGRSKGKQLWGLEFKLDSGELLNTLGEVVIVTNNTSPHGLFFDFGTADRIMVMYYEIIK